jgi:hypothetical protein
VSCDPVVFLQSCVFSFAVSYHWFSIDFFLAFIRGVQDSYCMFSTIPLIEDYALVSFPDWVRISSQVLHIFWELFTNASVHFWFSLPGLAHKFETFLMLCLQFANTHVFFYLHLWTNGLTQCRSSRRTNQDKKANLMDKFTNCRLMSHSFSVHGVLSSIHFVVSKNGVRFHLIPERSNYFKSHERNSATQRPYFHISSIFPSTVIVRYFAQIRSILQLHQFLFMLHIFFFILSILWFFGDFVETFSYYWPFAVFISGHYHFCIVGLLAYFSYCIFSIVCVHHFCSTLCDLTWLQRGGINDTVEKGAIRICAS